jgi:hypothetical protein
MRSQPGEFSGLKSSGVFVMSKELKIDLLRRARKLIESEKQMYICCALDAAKNYDRKEINAVVELTKSIIDVQLQVSVFFESWVIRFRNDLLPMGISDRRKYRLQWIDEMIRRLENDEEFVPLSSIAGIFHV